jgi:hypothetical protein
MSDTHHAQLVTESEGSVGAAPRASGCGVHSVLRCVLHIERAWCIMHYFLAQRQSREGWTQPRQVARRHGGCGRCNSALAIEAYTLGIARV